MYYCLYLLSVFSSLYISIWCWFSKTSSSFCGAASAEQEKEFLIKLQEFSCLGRSSFRVWVIILMKEGNSIRKVLWDTNELARLTGNINLSPSHCLPKLLDHNPKCTMLNKYRSTLGVSVRLLCFIGSMMEIKYWSALQHGLSRPGNVCFKCSAALYLLSSRPSSSVVGSRPGAVTTSFLSVLFWLWVNR